jgi:transposase
VDEQSLDGQAVHDLLDHFGIGTIMLADKAYDTARDHASPSYRGTSVNLPSKDSRKWKSYLTTSPCPQRNLIERFFSKPKRFGRVATYKKVGRNLPYHSPKSFNATMVSCILLHSLNNIH